MWRVWWIFSLLWVVVEARDPPNRQPAYPYVSPDGFRALCRARFDDATKEIEVARLEPGDTIFIRTELLQAFVALYWDAISVPVVLVTGDSDAPAPGPCAFLLDDPKLQAWFAQNVDRVRHPKLIPIPIGIENRCWGSHAYEILPRLPELAQGIEKNNLLYVGYFSVHTYPSERGWVQALFANYYCTTRKPFADYLVDLIGADFVLSPRGNGLDCHRTWEALYAGSWPIVRASAMDSIFENLPVVSVSSWFEVTEPFLRAKKEEFLDRQFDFSPLTMRYWAQRLEERGARLTICSDDPRLEFFDVDAQEGF